MSGSMSSILPGAVIVRIPPPPPLWQRVASFLLFNRIGRGLLVLILLRIYMWRRRQQQKRIELRSQLVLVTGGANGIGRALALVLAQRGARVAVWDIDQSALDETQRMLRDTVPGVQVYAARVDLANRDAINEAAAVLQSSAGFVFGVINNAGIVSGLPFLSLPPARIEQSMRVNVLSHCWTLQAFLPAMIREKRGHVVAVASAAGLFGAPLMADYCASKFAAVGLHESVRLELKKLGHTYINTTLVCPAHVDTKLFRGYKPGLLQRTLTPRELALTVVTAVEAGDELVLSPWPVRLAYILRGCFGAALDDDIKHMTGLTSSMDTWKGDNGS